MRHENENAELEGDEGLTAAPANADEIGRELTVGFSGDLIRRVAGRIARRRRLGSSERDDLEQDLRLELFRRMARFQPERGAWPAFVMVLVSRQARTLFRRCGRRSRPASLDMGGGVDGPSFASSVGNVDPRSRRQHVVRSDIENYELRHDLRVALRNVDGELAGVCEQLKAEPLAAVARQRQIPRRTLRTRLSRLREVFVDHALQDHL